LKIFFTNDHSKQAVVTRSCYTFSVFCVVFVLLSFWPLFVLRFTAYDCPYLQAVHNSESDQFIVSRECVAASSNNGLFRMVVCKEYFQLLSIISPFSSSCSTYETRRVTVKWQEHNLVWNCLNIMDINVSTDQMWVCEYLFRRIMTMHTIYGT
jgi:hypothetical protein